MSIKTSWLQQAACSKPEITTSVFFSETADGKRMRQRKVDYALSICRQCTVIDECAQDLVEVGHRRDIFPYQVRANRRLWVEEDILSLPEPR